MRQASLVVVVLGVLLVCEVVGAVEDAVPQDQATGSPAASQTRHQYEANWASLDARPMPEWFAQARFGIFVCWGPYCVPGWAPKGQYAEWYGHSIELNNHPGHDENSSFWKFHERVYGRDFKYEQFAPLMKGEMFDPEFWADLFVKSGAKYVILSAKYHDGFSLWPDRQAPGWNSMEVGAKRDVLGELTEAVRKRGLKMGIYFSLYGERSTNYILRTSPRICDDAAGGAACRIVRRIGGGYSRTGSGAA